jgi:hypothetical protein
MMTGERYHNNTVETLVVHFNVLVKQVYDLQGDGARTKNQPEVLVENAISESWWVWKCGSQHCSLYS